jgi:hypothetical protein
MGEPNFGLAQVGPPADQSVQSILDGHGGKHMFAGRLLLACTALLLPASPSHAQTVKPPIRGLVSMGAYAWGDGEPVNTTKYLDAKPGIFGGLVVIATWNQLQPTPTSQIGEGNPIDQALNLVRGYNQRNPQKPLGVRLRVWGGVEAPDWAKQIGGPPIQIVHCANGSSTCPNGQRTVGRFWLPAYRRAWANLQQQLAARFDKRPLIQEVSVTQCMSTTAEPFVVSMQDTVLGPLLHAGFNGPAYQRCLTHAIADYAPWQESRLVLSVNPLRTAPGQGPGDAAFTKRVMRQCREAVGVRCVFDNHDLNAQLDPPLVPIYEFMHRLGPEIVFQTANATPKNFFGTIALGVRYGASAIELYQDLPNKGFPVVPNDRLVNWARMIARNPAGPTQ